MSLEPDSGIDITGHELVILIKKLSPPAGGQYEWEQNVQVFLNNRQIDVMALDLKLNGGFPAPQLKLNVIQDESNSIRERQVYAGGQQ